MIASWPTVFFEISAFWFVLDIYEIGLQKYHFLDTYNSHSIEFEFAKAKRTQQSCCLSDCGPTGLKQMYRHTHTHHFPCISLHFIALRMNWRIRSPLLQWPDDSHRLLASAPAHQRIRTKVPSYDHAKHTLLDLGWKCNANSRRRIRIEDQQQVGWDSLEIQDVSDVSSSR